MTATDQLSLRQFHSLDELRAAATEWNDLWSRSDVVSPMSRAEHIAHWIEHFAPHGRFCALVVEQDGRLLAALPLVEHKLKGMLKVGGCPANEWSATGDLLLDPQSDIERVLDRFVSGLSQLRWPLLWLDLVPYTATRWSALLAACHRAGLATSIREQYEVGYVDINHDWAAYEATLSSNHRRNRKKQNRQLGQEGPVALRLTQEFTADMIDEQLREGFEIENRSWKGEAGTSVLKSPGMAEYYREEARLLAMAGQLELAFLTVGDRAVAFDYGWLAKGVHFTAKVGYDETYAKFGPGHLMLMHLLEQSHANPERRTVDFNGPMVPWFASWSTGKYPLGRVVIAGRNVLDRGLFHAYEHWFPRLKRWRAKLRSSATTETKVEPAATS